MAEHRPDSPFSGDLHIVDGALLKQTRVGGIRVLQNLVSKEYLSFRSSNVRHTSPRQCTKLFIEKAVSKSNIIHEPERRDEDRPVSGFDLARSAQSLPV